MKKHARKSTMQGRMSPVQNLRCFDARERCFDARERVPSAGTAGICKLRDSHQFMLRLMCERRRHEGDAGRRCLRPRTFSDGSGGRLSTKEDLLLLNDTIEGPTLGLCYSIIEYE